MNPNVKVFVSHRIDLDSQLVENDIFYPVRCGAVFDKQISIIPGDDTGDNISNLRESYCELTVQYWAWKNVEADYYGLCHYRRYLSFAEKPPIIDNWSLVNLSNLGEKAITEHRLNDTNFIQNFVSQYDLLTMIPVDLKKVNRKSVYDQYKQDGVKLHLKDLDMLLSIIKEKHPAYYDAATSYLHGQKLYLSSVFIMKKTLFQDYCTWLFDILQEFSERTVMDNYSQEAFRTPGHLGERLFGIYYTWLQQKGNCKSCELPLLFFNDASRKEVLQPTFANHSIPIAFSCSEAYSPFFATTLQSVINTSNERNNYDIFLLHQGLSNKTKTMLQGMLSGKSNFSLRFVNVQPYFEHYNLYESPTISIETYFRLILPEILQCYDKLLYLDCDLIVNKDIADLYHIDIGDKWLGAAVDVCGAGVVNGFDPAFAKYVEDTMRLKKIWMQFNAGVLIMNNRALRENFTTRYLLEFVQGGTFRFQDQDALNILCEDHIYWLDLRWNFAADDVTSYRGWVSQYAPRELYTAHRAAAKDPYIIHYAGNEKPWYHLDLEWADRFWTTLIQTPFYACFLNQRINDIVRSNLQTEFPTLLKNSHKKPVAFFRRITNKLLPIGSHRRNEVKRILKKMANRWLPIGSRRRNTVKKLIKS